jgi:hypothetical protein
MVPSSTKKKLCRRKMNLVNVDGCFLGGGGAPSQNCKKRLLASSRLICPPVRPSARPPVRPSAHLPVCPFARLHGTIWLPLEEFSLNLIFEYFSKICRENSVSLTLTIVTGTLCWPLVPKIAGSNPSEAVGFFRLEKSTACLPSEGN